MAPNARAQRPVKIPKIFEVDNGVMTWNLHEKQIQGIESKARFPVNLKGWRAGFTSSAAKWLENEMIRCGPGDLNSCYFLISPTHEVGKKGLIPAIETVFVTYMGYCTYNRNEHYFETTESGEQALWGHAQKERTKIRACYAANPNSFASMTAIAGVADELGQQEFKYESWITLRARCSTFSGAVAPNNPPGWDGMTMGRIYSGTTVYYCGWLEDIYNEWRDHCKKERDLMLARCEAETDAAKRVEIQREFNARMYHGQVHPEFGFVRFDSTANPAFDPKEFENARRTMPDWMFDMRYRAIFRKPAGTIFEHYEPSRHYIKGFKISSKWPIRAAIDLGRKNFYATFWAEDPRYNRHFAFAHYHRSGLDYKEHGAAIHKAFPKLEWCVAGQISEDHERSQLMDGGLDCRAPAYKGFWTGVNNFGAGFKANKIFIFSEEPYDGMPDLPEGFGNGCYGFHDELRGYSRPVDDRGIPKEDAEPVGKDTYHWVDSGRYYFTIARNSDDMALTDARAAAVPDAADSGRVVVATPQQTAALRAGGALSPAGRARAARYGFDAGCIEPHLDLRLR